jgi:serine/threonine-protein kinase
MSTVYLADRMDGGPAVAVKVLQDHLVNDDDQRERFEREARALFGLSHANILAVHDFGVYKQLPYLVMERLEGGTLDALLEQNPPAPDAAIEIAKQILTGLTHAHAQGVLHRDLKAENVFIGRGPDGVLVAKLLDFGLVKFVDDDRWGQGKVLTTFGEVFGTPAYMSPEQCTGAPVDARTDVYSMGVLLFELLTGTWPFMEETRVDMMRAHLTKPIPPLRAGRPDVEFRPELDAIVKRAMAKDSNQRFADAGQMLEAVQRLPVPVAIPKSAAATASGFAAPTHAALGAPPPAVASSGGMPWLYVALLAAGLFVVAVLAAVLLLVLR